MLNRINALGLMALGVLVFSIAATQGFAETNQIDKQGALDAAVELDDTGTEEDAIGIDKKGSEAELPESYYNPITEERNRLAIGDVLKISLLGQPDMVATHVPIAPDGKLYYMMIDGIDAVGRFPEDVKIDIEKSLKEMFSSPQIAIMPVELSTSRYYVYGKVNYPGMYRLDQALTVREAIARSGGLATGIYRGTTVEIASLQSSYLMRGDKKVPINFKKLLNSYNGRNGDIYIRAGDVVYIGSGLGSQSEVYLLGAVKAQKAIAYSDNMTLIDALAGGSQHGGGLSPEAYKKQILILRGSVKSPQVFEINLEDVLRGRARNIYLMQGDIVYVPKKPFVFTRSLMRMVVDVFVKTYAFELGDIFAHKAFFRNYNEEQALKDAEAETSGALDL